jgi:predicted transcriptional regulator
MRKADTTLYASLGACMEEVRNVYGLTLQQFAHELGRNESQIRRQIQGTERPMLEAVFAVERFRAPLVIALAKMAAGVEVQTVISVRRSA